MEFDQETILVKWILWALSHEAILIGNKEATKCSAMLQDHFASSTSVIFQTMSNDPQE